MASMLSIATTTIALSFARLLLSLSVAASTCTAGGCLGEESVLLQGHKHHARKTSTYASLWADFKLKYNKTHGSEEAHRFEIFKGNIDYMNYVNAQNLTHKLGVNQFTDLTNVEFRSMYTRRPAHEPLVGAHSKLFPFPNISALQIPDSLDWTKQNAVTAVKQAGQCGSCWAIAAVGAIEGAYAIATGTLLPLSAMQVVACTYPWANGCEGGWPPDAYKYVQEYGGLCAEKDYPYTDGLSRCLERKCEPQVTVSGYVSVPEDESSLLAAVALGPVAVGFDTSKRFFQYYTSGVVSSSCGHMPDSAMLIVGYGTDGEDYWKLQHSWGTSWGEKGYIRIARGRNLGCGIKNGEPLYPKLVEAVR